MVSRQAIQYRARRAGDFTDDQWRDMLDASGHRCHYCGRADRPLIPEHKTPISRGGLHTASNVVPACKPCNTAKCDMTAEEYEEQRHLRATRPAVATLSEGNAMTTAEVAQALGYRHPGSVRKLVELGHLTPERYSPRVVLFRREDVEAYAAARKPRGRPRAPRPAREGDGAPDR